MIIGIAQHEFVVKPMATITCMHNGIQTVSHGAFWRKKSINDLYQLHLALTATSSKVIEILEADAGTENEARILGYLTQFIGNMDKDVLRRFLRFATVCIAKKDQHHFQRYQWICQTTHKSHM